MSGTHERWSWKLGTIAGIPTRIHASFVLILAWVGWTAWSSTGSILGVVVGLAFIGAVFGSVLAHEFGHALMAREHGVATRSITLYPIGGVALLDDAAPSARAEAQIALAGPAVNAALAAVLGLVFWAAPDGGFVASFAGSLALANVGLGVFNMLPAFPMDGGRVLRAVLQPRVGRLRATEIAVRFGRVGAIALGAYGLFTNPWLVLIAGVLWTVGTRELEAARVRTMMAAAMPGQWWSGRPARRWPDVGRPDARPGTGVGPVEVLADSGVFVTPDVSVRGSVPYRVVMWTRRW